MIFLRAHIEMLPSFIFRPKKSRLRLEFLSCVLASNQAIENAESFLLEILKKIGIDLGAKFMLMNENKISSGGRGGLAS